MDEQQLRQVLEQLPPEVVMILLQLPSDVLALFAQLSDQDRAEIMQMIQAQGGQQPQQQQQPQPEAQPDTGNAALFGEY